MSDRPNTIDSFIAYETGCGWWATTAPGSISRREHPDRVRHQRGIRDLAQHYELDAVTTELAGVTERLENGHDHVYGPDPKPGTETLYIDLLRRYETLMELEAYLWLRIPRPEPKPNVEPVAPTAPATQIEMPGVSAGIGKVW